jgi:hypothetical protein
LEEVLNYFLYNDATATIDAATRASVFTTMTAQATQEYATRTVWAIMKATNLACWATAGKTCLTVSPTTLTPEPSPSTTPVPSVIPTPPSAVPTMAAKEQVLLILLSVLVIVLIVIGIFFGRKLWKNYGKLKKNK